MTSRNEYQEFSTVKYEITMGFEIQGVVEKSDVVGAIFGQTEGLIGESLDIRELQKSGRIGRINVDMDSKEGITSGVLTIPSSLDKIETAILAATIETVDRVGPCIAKFTLQNLVDVRKTKRDKIIDRATELLQKWELEVSPESQEITDKVSDARAKDDITTYGDEDLPAGPEIETSDTIIICEGRADILNLLSIGVKNGIATNGTMVPRTIAELSKTKTTIAFLDGDRGGDMILNELVQVGKIDFVARAPDGKEVEDLTKKELLKALQAKTPFVSKQSSPAPSPGTSQQKFPDRRQQRPPQYQKKQEKVKQPEKKKRFTSKRGSQGNQPRGRGSKKNEPQKVDVSEPLKQACTDLLGTTKAIFFDANLSVVKQVPTSTIVDELQKEDGHVKKVVFDGIVSQRLIDIAQQEGVDIIIGTRVGNVNKPNSIKILAMEQCISMPED